MAHQSAMIAEDIASYLKAHEQKGLLRFITCGSVDDGKSTLIGRLLWDSKMIFEDQLAALEADSKRVGTQGENIDYALLMDGLQAEREQGITIDVAYRFFSTDKRKFIVADTPGHEQYTRNMVTGASNAQVAVILVDARKGILTQTRRHSYLVSLVGIRKVVLAVNKMDLVDYSAERFAAIRGEYEMFAAGLGFEEIIAIPISALQGDNVIAPGGAMSCKETSCKPEAVSCKETSCKLEAVSCKGKAKADHNTVSGPLTDAYSLQLKAYSSNTPWYQGPTLMEYLETVPVAEAQRDKPFRLPVQWVNRPNLDFRGFSGTIASGTIRPGDPVVVPASGQQSTVARIVTFDGDLDEAVAGQAVTLTLNDEIDASRGDVLAGAEKPPVYAERFTAKVVWLHQQPLRPGLSYLLKNGSSTTPVRIGALDHKVNVNSLQNEPGESLELNEVGVCTIGAGLPLAFDPYRENPGTGNFILVDRFTNATVGAGMIERAVDSVSQGAHQQIDPQARAGLKGQQPRVLWFNAAPEKGAPKLAARVEKKLFALGLHTHLFDGDQLRDGLNRDLGTDDQLEQVRRAAEVARVCLAAGLVVLVAVDAPSADSRRLARQVLAEEDLVEIGGLARLSGDQTSAAPDIAVAETESIETAATRIVRKLYG